MANAKTILLETTKVPVGRRITSIQGLLARRQPTLQGNRQQHGRPGCALDWRAYRPRR